MNNLPPKDDAPLYEFDTPQSSGQAALLKTNLPLPRRSGKVRDVYDLGSEVMIVSSDRISAFDFILPSGIPGKGRLLTKMSQFWFSKLNVRHHLKSVEIPKSLSDHFDTTPLEGRIMIVEKAKVIPFECVVRGYLEGGGLREYELTGEVCGNHLPTGLRQCDKLPEPIFTPATKAEEGEHDENVSLDRMITDLGSELAFKLRDESLRIYNEAADYAASKGILIADTKFEFGLVGDELVLVDEVLTPDSSRFWDAATYAPGIAQQSFDKQFVREYLSSCGWDKQSDPPPLPDAVIAQTAAKYQIALRRISGE
ncbi:Phosphoribosylaminoimidazole-succinocarboxamide synthase [Novipirellula aureliae]|uniref:Phosphoribosylaminoimidazole-succinocarboxamide synthase n=1 Tax=Novipirellula aureliae TaxID=2527966 RepID=A0A5C6E2Y0_9BACT|nr:phosphoribosylaminoimidazolesuccinocarboxamide synthase [Novipirellula aureliae]TWU43282.1 Phosphoribosylaminoimidazole-succinocarboxamide synthase [Novipirellula aureliae]